ncbi:MAG: hypothetical protein C3F06_14100 [Candidatus Methanoperedenaceae archaeon]|nr:MAG: hypothetical protein C3F06_14100 [Candidatus Methanoperedenaceae archaeon]
MSGYTLLIIILTATLVVSSGCTEKSGILGISDTKPHNEGMEPIGMTKEKQESREQEAIMKGDYQEVDLKINASGYTPNVIIAKKRIPLKIKINSEEDAGCASEIVFEDFNIRKVVPAGSSGSIEILPAQEGTFNFRCPMDMVRGKLIINQ